METLLLSFHVNQCASSKNGNPIIIRPINRINYPIGTAHQKKMKKQMKYLLLAKRSEKRANYKKIHHNPKQWKGLLPKNSHQYSRKMNLCLANSPCTKSTRCWREGKNFLLESSYELVVTIMKEKILNNRNFFKKKDQRSYSF